MAVKAKSCYALRGALSASYHKWHVKLWRILRLPKWSRNLVEIKRYGDV